MSLCIRGAFAAILSLGLATIALADDTPKKTTGSGTGTRTSNRSPRSFMNGGPAADFAPGAWTDGAEHHVADYKGKVLLVFSFDPKYIDSPADVKRKLQTFDIIARDKPVAFLGVVAGPRDIVMSKSLIKPVEVAVPMYFDNIGQMSSRYPSGYTAVYVHMIDADGNFTGSVTPQQVDAALKDVKWKYKDNGYDKHLDAIVELFEWNHYDAGMKKLQPLRKSSNKEVAASADKLFQDVHAECEKWKAQADGAKDTDPVKAYDLYAQLAAIFLGDPLGKLAEEGLRSLKGNKAVQDELATRAAFRQLYNVMPRAKYEQRVDVADFCEGLARKYPDTPTAARAKQLATDIMSGRTLD
jgi:hypothetical protein